MSEQIVQGIGQALRDIASREGVDLRRVVCVAVVGNTAMLALLTGRNYSQLLQPTYWTKSIDCGPGETHAWTEVWGVHPHTDIQVIPACCGLCRL